eukprot:363811-Chlamydomonas_euryale.AAC.20
MQLCNHNSSAQHASTAAHQGTERVHEHQGCMPPRRPVSHLHHLGCLHQRRRRCKRVGEAGYPQLERQVPRHGTVHLCGMASESVAWDRQAEHMDVLDKPTLDAHCLEVQVGRLQSRRSRQHCAECHTVWSVTPATPWMPALTCQGTERATPAARSAGTAEVRRRRRRGGLTPGLHRHRHAGHFGQMPSTCRASTAVAEPPPQRIPICVAMCRTNVHAEMRNDRSTLRC